MMYFQLNLNETESNSGTQKRPLYQMLELLLSQGEFELIPYKDTGYDTGKCPAGMRLVYLMNDAVESFLLFENARLTGRFCEGEEIEYASVERNADEYVMILRQRESTVSLFYSDLSLETYLFNYGKTGHFWVKEYEYLRQLEYRIAILRDKREYLGEEYCSEEEVKLSWLAEFPPLNFCCYPAVPKKYAVFPEPDWTVSQRAIAVMMRLSEEVHDQNLLRLLILYERIPSRFVAKWIANVFTKEKHAEVIDLIDKKLAEEAARYPDRVFELEEEEEFQRIRERAQNRKRELVRKGVKVELLKEEPFLYAKDSIEYKIHLMLWKKKKHRRIVEIETFEKDKDGIGG